MAGWLDGWETREIRAFAHQPANLPSSHPAIHLAIHAPRRRPHPALHRPRDGRRRGAGDVPLRGAEAVCPYSGLPDFATLTIRYVPRDRCVELKSLKYYVTSYRSVGIFQEHATAKIAEDLFRVLEPQRLVVTTVYNVRGGFETTCSVDLPAS